MPFLYYGLVVVATAAIVLAVYNLIVVRWCATQSQRSREANHLPIHRRNNNIMLSRPPDSRVGLTSSVRYKKGLEDADFDMECSVCLSVYEDGEEVRKLPRCNHSFHIACIDMWLYSHMDCPLCRAPVMVSP
ncbi:RING-H2 finger protein ATL52-like [Bidens hawaiensis]|uniref:RING-H2 finger protein ATL52-like n=1 Tax=Bidens hawaiensis TaxID=980011 RepID=UPI00404AC184